MLRVLSNPLQRLRRPPLKFSLRRMHRTLPMQLACLKIRMLSPSTTRIHWARLSSSDTGRRLDMAR
jgi:hypothetical protein